MLAPGLEVTAWGNAVWNRPRGGSGVTANVAGLGTLFAAPSRSDWVEYGARAAYALSPRFTAEIFANGSTGENGVGEGFQAGAALRIGL